MGLTLDDLHQIYARTDHYLAQAKVNTMKRTEITSSIQLAARLTDGLFEEGIVNSDSAQALFDVLADALEKRPDIVAAVSEDLRERQREKDDYLAEVMERIKTIEDDVNSRWNHTRNFSEQDAKDTSVSVTGGHNND